MTESLAAGTIGSVSHGIAVLAFVLLSALSLLNWERTKVGGWLIGACLMTALWAGVKAYASLEPATGMLAAVPLETLRTGAWLGFLLILLGNNTEPQDRGWLTRWVGPLLVAVVVLLFVAEVVEAVTTVRYGSLSFPAPSIFGKLILAVGGLLLIENLYRNTNPESRWGVKFLCLGLGALFIYDLYFYANAMLFHRLDLWVLEARGLTNALIVPLLAVSAARNPDWKVDLFVSRRLAFYSVTLMASGAYLVVMALVGYYLRVVGGSWGSLLQVAFLFGAGLLLVVVLFSGRYRSQIRVFISKHFFNYRYDYREEWLRFIHTISTDPIPGGLRERAIKAVADIVDSPGGILMMSRDNSDLSVVATWNLPPDLQVVVPADSAFVRFLSEHEWVIDLREMDDPARMPPDFELPGAVATIPHAWLIVPLIHHDRLIGAMVLQAARAPRDLNWEDLDLIKTVGRQVSSYLAEQETAKALAQARQFETFNRRFAFVLHDIKNLVSQLSLMVANAQKHADNPEFQRDMLLTVQESVAKMKALLERLHSQQVETGEEETEIVGLLNDLVARKRDAAGDRVKLSASTESLWVRGGTDKLSTVFEHLVQNAIDAIDAIDADGGIEIRVLDQGTAAQVEIEDTGSGMDAEFIRNQLFRPFRSTKKGGYGIGAYESRQIVEEAGGSLDVKSTVGEGTTVLVNLPKDSAHDQTAKVVQLESR